MDKLFERYLNKLGVSLEIKEAFDGAFFKSYQLTNAQTTFQGEVFLPHLLNYEIYDEFFQIINKFASLEGGFVSDLRFTYSKAPSFEEVCSFVKQFIEYTNAQQLENFRYNQSEKEIVFEYSQALSADLLLGKAEPLVSILKKASLPLKVTLGLVDSFEEATQQINNDFIKDSTKQAEMNMLRQKAIEKQEELDRTYVPCTIKDASTCSLKRVAVVGTIFDLEVREIKNHTKKLAIISYYDNSYSIVSNVFEGKKYDANFIASLKIGDRIGIKGQPMYDDYAKQVTIRLDSIEILPPLKPREDDYPGEKRIELHLHTQMSTMDGTGDIKEYVSTAARWGWTALGITDHGGVQAFPALQDSSKGKLKPLFGCELYLVDSELHIVFNSQDRLLRECEYTVFDLETTGLSSRYDRIIEFGATKIKNGQVLNETDFFINPDRKLSSVTTNLTGIKDSDVESGKSIKQALRDILDFIGDSVLVAHNATFDFGFINEALKNNNMPVLTNPVIDTLPLSRFLFQDMRSHTLGSICKKLDVNYDEDEAHRAIYDAQVLKSCWEAMETTLLNNNAKMVLGDLNNLLSFIESPEKREEIERNIILTAPHPFHVVAYAKDSQGLKDLFQIISDSNTKYISNIPRVPKHLLTQYRSHLLLGSACFNGEVFQTAMTKGKDIAEDIMKYYDYIEVQPPCNYSFLVNDGQLTSMDDVYKIIKDIIKMAQELNKPVVATSDCHYVKPEDKIFRDVFIFAKGLKGARHPMNPYRRDKMKYYDNPDQHLRTTSEMLEEFKFLEDEELIKKIVITNTHLIADQISDDIHPIHSGLSAPTIDNCDVLLKNKVYETAHKQYGDPLPQVVADRLEAEMSGISANHYEVIYWIASKLVTQANADGYIVGSRGSVGSSLVATMSGITEVNPLQPHYRCPKCLHSEWIEPTEEIRSGFDLPEKNCPICGEKMIHDGQNIPFATFIGFHAEKTPDIDLNFPPDYQSHAHELTKTLLTKESGNHVYKAGTIESVADNMAIGYVKGYFESLEKHPELHIKAEDISKTEILRIAKGCIGVKRTTGQHPGGIIVIPRGMDVTDFTPIQFPADDTQASWNTSHFDFNSMHDTILKLDLLGHVDPMALRMMGQISGKNIYEIPCNDKDVMSLFTSPDALHMKNNYLGVKVGTMGMPEFGTNFSMNLLEETKPTKFADLLIVSGLSHGTNVYAGNQQDLIKNGVTDLRGVVGCRDDIMMNLHNEFDIPFEDSFQIMEIVRHGRFNPTVKKSYEKYVKYTKMMQEHHVPQYFIDSCNKIAYLFPKAHAVAYCMMGVRVGWFKVHDPLAFYATYFTCRADQFDLVTMIKGERAIIDKLHELDQLKEIQKKLKNTEADLQLVLQMSLEMIERGFSFAPIDIDQSLATQFKMDREHNCLIPPFTALSGVGEAAAISVVEARNIKPFSSIEDFSKRTKITEQKVNELKEMGSFKDLPDSSLISLF